MFDMVSNHVSKPAGGLLEIGPTTNMVLLSAAATGGAVSVVEMRLPAGFAGPPPHRHERVSHVWLVTAGEVELMIDDTTGRYSEGDCLHVPAGIAHGFSTAETGGATVLQIDTPGALDGYLTELADAFPTGADPDPVVIAAIMARHDTTPA